MAELACVPGLFASDVRLTIEAQDLMTLLPPTLDAAPPTLGVAPPIILDVLDEALEVDPPTLGQEMASVLSFGLVMPSGDMVLWSGSGTSDVDCLEHSDRLD